MLDPADLHVSRQIAAWLQAILPKIAPVRDPDACWVAGVKTRSPEHHPPLYWLGRALDETARVGLAEAVAALVLHAHGPRACGGWSEDDQRLQDVLSEVCATAWTFEHLGPAVRSTVALDRPGDEQPLGEAGERPLLYVSNLDAWVAPRRMWPVRTMEQLLRQAGARMEEAAAAMPRTARSRTVYLDIPLNMFGWAQDVGYAGPTTDPLRAAVKHFAGEYHVGYVLTRPFQWGVPLETWY
ncbi:MAG: hypothetical protein EXR66_00670 [Dehalococcoidia bacterium]|nr:hypothetical protein [Dehalococcoidia bacterium]